MGGQVSPTRAAATADLLRRVGYVSVSVSLPQEGGTSRIRVVAYPPRAGYSQRIEVHLPEVVSCGFDSLREFGEAAVWALTEAIAQAEASAGEPPTTPLF